MVTPSFLMVGAPNFLSRTTLRPLGPSVTLTASASAFTPRSSALRASASNASILAIALLASHAMRPGRESSRGGSAAEMNEPAPRCEGVLLVEHREDVAGGE